MLWLDAIWLLTNVLGLLLFMVTKYPLFPLLDKS